jgi:hypothetical protein
MSAVLWRSGRPGECRVEVLGAAIDLEILGLGDGEFGPQHGPQLVVRFVIELERVRPQPMLDAGSIATDFQV